MFCKNCGTNLPEDAIFCSECGIKSRDTAEECANATEEGNKFSLCPKCYTHNDRTSCFCKTCGTNLTSPPTKTESYHSFSEPASKTVNVNTLIWKLLCMIGGLIGIIFGSYTVYTDKNGYWEGYTYQPPLTDHEIGIITLIIISSIIFLIGCCIPIYKRNDS